MNRDYEVGYRKPPRASQWMPGQSGNPDGRKGNGARPKAGAANPRLSKLAQRKVSITKDGRQRQVDVAEALDLSLLQKALGGNRLALEKLRAAIELAEAEMREDTIHRHAFWADWRKRHEATTLNWPRQDGRTPILPHPLDIIINPITREISFTGPMDEEELPLFDAQIAAVEFLAIESEELSDQGIENDGLMHTALILFKTMPPSVGGPAYDEAEEAYLHRYVAMLMTIRSLTKAQRLDRKRKLQAMIDRGHRLAQLDAAGKAARKHAHVLARLTNSLRPAAKVKP